MSEKIKQLTLCLPRSGTFYVQGDRSWYSLKDNWSHSYLKPIPKSGKDHSKLS